MCVIYDNYRCYVSLRTGVISLRTFRKGAKVHNAGNLSNDFSKKVSRGETLKPSARDGFLIESLMLVKSLFETP